VAAEGTDCGIPVYLADATPGTTRRLAIKVWTGIGLSALVPISVLLVLLMSSYLLVIVAILNIICVLLIFFSILRSRFKLAFYAEKILMIRHWGRNNQKIVNEIKYDQIERAKFIPPQYYFGSPRNVKRYEYGWGQATYGSIVLVLKNPKLVLSFYDESKKTNGDDLFEWIKSRVPNSIDLSSDRSTGTK
jgi:hypothetical protein